MINWSMMKTAENIFAEKKETKKSEVASERYNAETSGILWKTYNIPTDRDSRSIMASAYLTLDEGASREWKLKDITGNDVMVTLSKSEFLEIGKLIAAHVQTQFDKEAVLRTQIEAAQTEEELNKIIW